MALIRLGGLVTDISGKIGGQTLGTSASGSYIKNSGTPRKSITNSQQSQMQLMGTTAQRWRSLTQAQRDAFNAASPDYPYLNRVGETKYYSGYAIFCQLANNSQAADIYTVPVPLPKFSFTPLTNVEFLLSYPDLEVNAEDAQNGVSYRFFMSRISSVGISNSYKNQFFIGKDDTHASGFLNIDLASPLYTKWGPLTSNGKFFWHFDAVHLSTGQVYKNINSGTYTYS